MSTKGLEGTFGKQNERSNVTTEELLETLNMMKEKMNRCFKELEETQEKPRKDQEELRRLRAGVTENSACGSSEFSGSCGSSGFNFTNELTRAFQNLANTLQSSMNSTYRLNRSYIYEI